MPQRPAHHTLNMTDDMRFSPTDFSVKRGAVRFVWSTRGQIMHEVVLGTQANAGRNMRR